MKQLGRAACSNKSRNVTDLKTEAHLYLMTRSHCPTLPPSVHSAYFKINSKEMFTVRLVKNLVMNHFDVFTC